MTHRNNANLRRLAHALRLDKADIAEIVRVSKNRADAWLRGADATKAATGTEAGGPPQRRYRRMRDEEFDAFCERLGPWYDEGVKGEGEER